MKNETNNNMKMKTTAIQPAPKQENHEIDREEPEPPENYETDREEPEPPEDYETDREEPEPFDPEDENDA